jgi:hypothetical protein
VDYCAAIKNDAKFKEEAAKARLALKWQASKDKEEGKVLPTFVPTFDVSEISDHGHQIYSKATRSSVRPT